MPIDPVTGQRLPDPGEEGAEAGPPAEQDETTAQLQGEKAQVDDLLGQLDSALGNVGEGEEAQAEGEQPAEGVQQDLSPLEETLGVTRERAEMLYMAAQELDSTKNKTPADLAKLIAEDFDILMQLEVIAARGMENQPEPEAPMMGAPEEVMPEEMMSPEGM